jgi:hypothetical protein
MESTLEPIVTLGTKYEAAPKNLRAGVCQKFDFKKYFDSPVAYCPKLINLASSKITDFT